jgi:hypothetical protein
MPREAQPAARLRPNESVNAPSCGWTLTGLGRTGVDVVLGAISAQLAPAGSRE